jgi:hypothetical protein
VKVLLTVRARTRTVSRFALADVKADGSVLGGRIGWLCSSGQRQALYSDSPTLGCDYVQQHIELQPLICSALLYSLDPVIGGLCMHILGLSLQ